MGAGAISGGFNATSICTMRREPGFWPTLGVTASDVSSHTGFATGVIREQEATPFSGTSLVPFQQICCPAAAAVLTGRFGNPIKFCLFVIRTHLNARALAPFRPGISALVGATVGRL